MSVRAPHSVLGHRRASTDHHDRYIGMEWTVPIATEICSRERFTMFTKRHRDGVACLPVTHGGPEVVQGPSATHDRANITPKVSPLSPISGRLSALPHHTSIAT